MKKAVGWPHGDICSVGVLEGLNRSALAVRFGRTRETITSVLPGPDFDQLRAEVDRGEAEDAKAILHRHRIVAANAWEAVVGTAAEKGDHRPTKDLLLHTRTIDPVADLARGGGVTIVLGDCMIPGLPISPTVEQSTWRLHGWQSQAFDSRLLGVRTLARPRFNVQTHWR